MRVRPITACGLGLAAALAVGNTLAAQQDTTKLKRTTSERQISISKGEVVASVRVDTVYVTRVDTVRSMVTRIDTVIITMPADVVVPVAKGNMFWGVYTGTTDPWGNIDRLYTKGFHAGGVLGWESQRSPIGLRLDGGMSQIGRENMGPGFSTTNIGSGTPLMLHLAGDLKVKPLNFGGWALYAIGGVNYNRYKRIALASKGTTLGGSCDFQIRSDCYSNANNTSWSDKFGFNGGAGLDFHIGSQDMFLEARYMAIAANGARSWTLPISLGVRYF